MNYALLIYEKPGTYDGLDEAQRAALTAEYMAVRADPRIVDGARLMPASMATTVRVEDGRSLISDGPFADTKEVFGGYFICRADHLDEALELAARLPAARLGGSVEVRPLMEAPR